MLPSGALSRTEVAGLVGISVTTMYRLEKAGLGPPRVKLGRRTVIYPRDGFEAWLKNLAASHAEAGQCR